MAAGAVVVSQSGKYRLGTATHMGPGYFPMVLAVALFVLGAASIGQALAGPDRTAVLRPPLKPLVFLIAGVVAFGLLIERAGLIAATFALILLVAHDRLRRHPIEVALVFVGVTTLCSALFIFLLGLPIALF